MGSFFFLKESRSHMAALLSSSDEVKKLMNIFDLVGAKGSCSANIDLLDSPKQLAFEIKLHSQQNLNHSTKYKLHPLK